MEKIASSSLIIADSSGLVSLVTSTDSNHAAAIAASQSLVENDARILVPSDIFTETLNVLGKKVSHQAAIQAAETMLSSEAFFIDNSTADIRRNALKQLAFLPSGVSFADCLVMAFADFYGTRNIFGFDEVFDKNGYNALELPAKT